MAQKKEKTNPIAKDGARYDSFINFLTGIGDFNRDKRLAAFYQGDVLLDDQTLENVFHGNDIAARICEIVPEEMLRQGFTLNIGGDEEGSEQNRAINTALMSICDDLGLREKFTDAGVWANVFGGSALFVGAMDGLKPEEALDEESIESLNFLTVLDKRDLIPFSWYNDPLLPNYGRPATYRIIPTALNAPVNSHVFNTEIHESRLVVFQGTRTSLRRKQNHQGWNLSLLQRVWEVLTDFNMTWNSMSNLMQTMGLGVFKIKDLAQMIAEGEETRLQARMQSVSMAMSSAKDLILDAEFESFERIATNISEAPAMLEKFMLRLAAAARIPVPILMGQPPSGLNATMEADMRWFYDTIKAQQVNSIKPRIERIIRLLMLSKNGPTNGQVLDFNVGFPPLWQNNESEDAKVRLAIAQSDVAYIQAGVLLPEEVAISRFRPEGYSTETIVDLESRSEELAFKAAQSPGQQPSNAPPVASQEEPQPNTPDPSDHRVNNPNFST